MVSTSAMPTSPPLYCGGRKVSREQPVSSRPPSRGEAPQHRPARDELAHCSPSGTRRFPVIIERTRLTTPAAATSTQVHDDEQDEQHGAERVQRTGRLPAAEHVEQPGRAGGDAGRLRQPGQHHERHVDEDEQQVRKLLQRAVADRRLGRPPRPAQVLAHLVPQVPQRQLVAAGQQVAREVSPREVPPGVDQAVDQKHPGEREVVVAAPHPVAQLARLVPGQAPVGELEDGRMALVARVAPVQLRKVEEDVDAAEQQIAAGDDVDPVADADVGRMYRQPAPGAGARPLGRLVHGFLDQRSLRRRTAQTPELS